MRHSDLDQRVPFLRVHDREGYHVIFERDEGTNAFLFPNIAKFENEIEVGGDGKTRLQPKTVVHVNAQTNCQRKTINAIFHIVWIFSFIVAIAYNPSLNTHSWQGIVCITGFAISGSIVALVALRIYTFKRKVDQYLANQMKTNVETWKNPASYGAEDEGNDSWVCKRIKRDDVYIVSFQAK